MSRQASHALRGVWQWPEAGDIGRRTPFRVRELAGMVEKIAGNQCALALGFDHHADMPRRVSRRWHQSYLRANLLVLLNEIDQARIEDRHNQIGE